MIEFKVLAIKAKTDDMHIIFLLKKNIRSDIIKIILEYSLIAVLEILKKWKMTIIKDMSLQKADTTIELEQKSHIKEEKY